MSIGKNQAMLLWLLAITKDGSSWLKDIQPRSISDNKVREPLRDLGYISEARQKFSGKNGKPVTALKITLEDRGWAWLAENLDTTFPRSRATAEVLEGILGILKNYLGNQDIAFPEFISHQQSLESSIEETYKDLDQHGKGERVRISDISHALAQVELRDLHEALMSMQENGILTLYPIDNPRDLSKQDELCAITLTPGSSRHIVVMDGQK